MTFGGLPKMDAQGGRLALLHLINGFRASQAVHVAATLGLADLLNSGPKAAAELAVATETHPAALYRLMRALASIGVFEEDEAGRFALTTVGEFLRSDIAGTHAPTALLVGRPDNWQAWADLSYAVRSGATAFDHVHGSSVWEYRAKHPEESRIFDRAMAAGTERFAEIAIGVCNFGRFGTVVDIGGGDGVFLAKILAAHPRVCGILFDQPHVISQAAGTLESFGLADRCQVLGGNFFVQVPDGGDAYLLKWILHDWNDEACLDILRSCRRSMKPSGRLLIAEHLIGPPNTSPDGKFMDLTMMVMNGGRERTREEFAVLFTRAGFKLMSVTTTETSLSVLEAVPEPT